jgi:hypothetical protein
MEEELTDRQVLRIAQMIQERLMALRVARYSQLTRRLDSLSEQLGLVQSIRRKLGLAVGLSWYAAADKTASAITGALRDIPYHIADVGEAVSQCVTKTPTLGDLVAELRQLQDEFDQVKYDPQCQKLSITTDSIELENVFLGEFEVILEVSRLGEASRSSVYRVVALDPHPAASNDSVTHPHVSEEHLCEGDAGAAIGAALANGRVCDFFMLVRSVLQHYNPSSPYVSLADWHGSLCHECGSTMHEDDSHWCHSCENTFCDDCTSYCRRCEETTCTGCLETCEACGESVCPSCRTTCDECGKVLCTSCHEQGLCPCIEERKENEEDEHDNDETAAYVGAPVGPAVGDTGNTGAGQVSAGGVQETSAGAATPEEAPGPALAGASVLADGLGQAPVLSRPRRNRNQRVRRRARRRSALHQPVPDRPPGGHRGQHLAGRRRRGGLL